MHDVSRAEEGVVLYSIWGARTTYIAQLELLAVLVALIEVAGLVRGANTIWFIDNVAALMALVKGSSGSHSLDQMAKLVHLACLPSVQCPILSILNLQQIGRMR